MDFRPTDQGCDTKRIHPRRRAALARSTPVRPEAFGLFSVNVSDVDPFCGIDAAPNALAIDGVVATVRVAEAELPVPPFVDVTGAMPVIRGTLALPQQVLDVAAAGDKLYVATPTTLSLVSPPCRDACCGWTVARWPT